MTGPEHYRVAERLIDSAHEYNIEGDYAANTRCLAEAQIHATLSLAAATALGNLLEGGPLGADRYAWICAASEHPGQQQRIREAEAAEAAEFEEVRS